MHRPRKTLKSKVAHKNPYYKVRRDEYVRADGKKATYYSVIADPFVVICPFDREKNGVYIVKSWRYPLHRYLWEFPKGWRERSETPLMAAKRELTEETGLKAKKWKRIGWLHVAPGITNQKGYIFAAENLEEVKQREPCDEIVEEKFVTLLQLRKMAKKGQFSDNASLLAMYYLFDELN